MHISYIRPAQAAALRPTSLATTLQNVVLQLDSWCRYGWPLLTGMAAPAENDTGDQHRYRYSSRFEVSTGLHICYILHYYGKQRPLSHPCYAHCNIPVIPQRTLPASDRHLEHLLSHFGDIRLRARPQRTPIDARVLPLVKRPILLSLLISFSAQSACPSVRRIEARAQRSENGPTTVVSVTVSIRICSLLKVGTAPRPDVRAIDSCTC